MKKNFKKMLSVLLAVLMFCSVLTVATTAADTYIITFAPGYRDVHSNGIVVINGEFNDKIESAGDTYTDANGVVYTIDKVNKTLSIEVAAGGSYVMPEYFFELLGYVQDGWSTSEKGNVGTASQLKTGVSKTATADTTYYPRVSNSKTGPFIVTLTGGYRTINGARVYGELLDVIKNQPGNTYVFNGVEYTIDRENNVLTFLTNGKNYSLPSAVNFFKMPGFSIKEAGWSASESASSSTTSHKIDTNLTVSNNSKKLAPDYVQEKYEVKLSPGALGTGAEEVINSGATYNLAISLAGKAYTREGYVQIGWASTDGATEVEIELNGTFNVTGPATYYPVWQKVYFNVKHDVKNITFGSLCVDYVAPAAKYFTITNNSNRDLTFAIPASANFDIVASSTTIAADGGKVTISVQPKAGLPVGSYLDTLSFDFGMVDYTSINFSVPVKFVVNNHVFTKYVPIENTATYSHNGREVAECHIEGCKATHEREQEGSMKVYSVANNTADGILKEYLYHKTVKFVAYGSGMDDAEGVVGKRFRPTEWAVADTKFGGEFAETYTKAYDAADYTVKYDHGDGNFGTYTLTINYVEEENIDGKWVATGIEDVKTFKYSIGPSEKDNVEVVRPNMIVSIIFGLFGYLIDLITSGSLF